MSINLELAKTLIANWKEWQQVFEYEAIPQPKARMLSPRPITPANALQYLPDDQSANGVKEKNIELTPFQANIVILNQ